MHNEIPLWYKKSGNYSLLPHALNCNDKFNPNENELVEDPPKITSNELHIPINIKKKTWVYYWAANPKKNRHKINDPIKAYKNEKNSGLLESNKSGDVTLILNCPQPYRVDDVTYPAHVHYTTLIKEKDTYVWDLNVKTYSVYCSMPKKELIKVQKEGKHIIINALPEESYNEQHIPTSVNLPV